MSSAAYDDLWDDTPGPYVEPTETNAVRRDSFDKMSWAMITDGVPALREQVEGLAQDFETSPPAYEDLFNLLHQGDPRFTPDEQMMGEYLPQHQLMQTIYSGEDFRELRRDTRYDEYNTAFAMLTMASEMRKAFEELQEAINNAKPDDNVCGPWGPQGPPGPTAKDLEPVARKLERGLEKARKAIEDERATTQGFGGADNEEIQRMSFEERRALAERLDKGKLGKLAKLLGAYRPFADGERRRKIDHLPEEIVDVELGNDLTRLIPSEQINMSVPELRDLFMLRWTQRSLLQWKKTGTGKAGQGPVIVVCDESASMNNTLDKSGNTREEWSKAVAIALADQARRGKRDFTYIGFASSGQEWQLDFPGGVTPISKVIELAEHFFSGNTSYEGPLTRAMEIVKTYAKAGKPKPDVVFITDDECEVSEEFIAEWNETRAAASVRCYGIAIGVNGYANNMKDLTDRCINITKLNASPEGVQELFRTI